MKAKDFVDRVRAVVLDASVSDTISIMTTPPGRRPAGHLVEVSAWFKRLGDVDREMVKRIIEIGARQCIFGLLSVLDGSRQVESSVGPKGYFELRYVKDGIEDVLSGPRGEVLHELL